MGGRKTDTTTMVTLPSAASYPAYLEPLTENEKKLLDAYDAVRVYERETSRLKAEEADEADERYRAKVAERERVEGGSKNHEDKNEVIDVAKNNRSRPNESEGADDNNIDDEDDEVVDTVAIERRKQREIEISRLQKEVDEANLAKDRREAEKMKDEFMRRELLGDVTAMEEAGGTSSSMVAWNYNCQTSIQLTAVTVTCRRRIWGTIRLQSSFVHRRILRDSV